MPTVATSAGRVGIGSALLPLYVAILFLSAFLLFAVQPMFTKMVLPLLGGSPAVWNTAVVFFQATLLAGYLYAHLSTRLLGLRRQAILHGVVLALGLTVLPIGVAAGWTTPPEGVEIPWLIGLAAVSIGLPFFAVSATAPLLQLWFAHTDHARSGDPYFLYGGSNLGSLAALLSYPVVIEPALGLSAQGRAWSAGYCVLAAGIAVCATLLWRRYRAQAIVLPAQPESALVTTITWRVRRRWLLLSLAPSALLLGVTLHVSTDIASAPFLWVIPLALYLLTFVIAFARRPVLPHRWMLWLQLPVVGLAAVLFAMPGSYSTLVLHLAVLFSTAMVCHGELARIRPAPARLTEFYLWLSLGGVIGGFLAGIVAPLVFNGGYEYPLALLLALLLRPIGRGSAVKEWLARRIGRVNLLRGGVARWRPWAVRVVASGAHHWALDLALPLLLWWLVAQHWWSRGVAAALDLSAAALERLDLSAAQPAWAAAILPASIVFALIFLSRRPLRFSLAVAAMLFVFAPDLFGSPSYRLERVRTFFGLYSVELVERPTGRYHLLYSGTTIHGGQDIATPRRAITYYVINGPVGQALRAMSSIPIRRIGAIGLGVGALSCYLDADQLMTYYEIDAAVERLARNPNYFRFLEVCGENVDVVIGDGRLEIAKAPPGEFDLIILDAFSSDAIPVHLLTREAFAVYLEKLSPQGKLLIHITNRYLDLLPVVASVVADAGLHGRSQYYNRAAVGSFEAASEWVVVARSAEELTILDRGSVPWAVLSPEPGARPWTDDYSDVFRALRLGGPDRGR